MLFFKKSYYEQYQEVYSQYEKAQRQYEILHEKSINLSNQMIGKPRGTVETLREEFSKVQSELGNLNQSLSKLKKQLDYIENRARFSSKDDDEYKKIQDYAGKKKRNREFMRELDLEKKYGASSIYKPKSDYERD